MTELSQYTTCKDAIVACAEYLVKQLNASQGNILLLLSGRSSLNPVREAFAQLDDEVLSRIHVGQIDERFVDIKDEASNWRQIKEALGPALNKTASRLAILEQEGEPDDVAIAYEMELQSLLETADETIGVYGIGEDGHIAGMLSVANPADFTQFLDGRLCVAFKADDFTRITTTAALITKLNEVVLFACGPAKVKAISKLNQELPTHKHPAQLLKDAQRASLFIGEELA